MSASDLDVLGAPSDADRTAHPNLTFNAVNGLIVAVNPRRIVHRRADACRRPCTGLVYTVDPSHATYMEGKSSCLAPGITVQVIGSLAGTAMTAKIINATGAGCAGETHAEPPPPTPPAPASSNPK